MNEISINLVSTETLDNLESEKKVRYIIDEVKSGKVLVLERGLYPIEEAKLIETTMMEIDHETFIGIEMQSYNKEDVKKGNWLKKLLTRKSKPRMSVIGPADLLTAIRKDGKGIQAMILTKKFIVREKEKEQIIDKNQKHLEYWFGGKNTIDLNVQNKEEITNQENVPKIKEISEIEKEKINENVSENLNQENKEEKISENKIEENKSNENSEIEKQMSRFSLLKRFANFGRKKDKEKIEKENSNEENEIEKKEISEVKEEIGTEKKEILEVKENENKEMKTKRSFFSKFKREKERKSEIENGKEENNEIKNEEAKVGLVAEENSEIKEKKGFFSKFRKEKVEDMN